MKKYRGTVNGTNYQSLHPNVYRCDATVCIAGRVYNLEKVLTASWDGHARERFANTYRDIRGGIMVQQIGTLEEEGAR